MNKLKSFNEFDEFNSGNIDNFSKKVSILVDESMDFKKFDESLFSTHVNMDNLNEESSPVLIWKKMNNPKIKQLNEKSGKGKSIYAYNKNPLTINGRFFSKFIGEDFIPKTIRSRNKVKGLKFPIVAMHPLKEKKEDSVYNTYNKFQKSESHYTLYQEKVNPRTKYNVVFFKGEPISIKENINHTLYDTFSGSTPAMFEQLSTIAKRVGSAYPLDVFSLNVYESMDGHMYVKGIKSNFDLDKSELNELYVRLYEDYYETKLPVWLKNKINEGI